MEIKPNKRIVQKWLDSYGNNRDSLCFINVYFAPTLSKISPIVDHTAGITAIRSLCFSLLIIPILSALRGYFQGLNYSFPFGVSQLLEQLVRVVCILVGTYLIRVQFNGSILSAVILSTFASSIGE